MLVVVSLPVHERQYITVQMHFTIH